MKRLDSASPYFWLRHCVLLLSLLDIIKAELNSGCLFGLLHLILNFFQLVLVLIISMKRSLTVQLLDTLRHQTTKDTCTRIRYENFRGTEDVHLFDI